MTHAGSMAGYEPPFPFIGPIAVISGEGQHCSVPNGCELWFDAIVLPDTITVAGSVTFGSCIMDNGPRYPMKNQGFKTIAGTDFDSKAAATTAGQPPSNSVVSFIGQVSCGELGITNNTDRDIQVWIRWTYKRVAGNPKADV